MTLLEIIGKKRDGGELTREEIAFFIRSAVEKAAADYQLAALLMAIFLNGMTRSEQFALTEEMLNSGVRLNFSDVQYPKADKHSTGGVGDKTSLILAPIAAACGVCVPMISGRGLGHTGGTLDKLESIRGFRVRLSIDEIRRTIDRCGFALVGQTEDIAPADKKLYALRDATATVESIPLIVASIMSKKLAAGLDALIFDVKTGSGSFLSSFDSARQLAQELVMTARMFNVRAQALVTDMSQPLGRAVGNALEVIESIKILRNEVNVDDKKMIAVRDLSIELAARMVFLSGAQTSLETARSKSEQALFSGAALERLRLCIEAQHGDVNVCDDPEKFSPHANYQIEVKATATGFVNAIDTRLIGNAVANLGGGRIHMEDTIDPAVGFYVFEGLGCQVTEGDAVGVVHSNDEARGRATAERIATGYEIGVVRVPPPPLIHEVISSD